ncbi:MAG: DUF192 domain-containing protein [Candidatus Marsarchaeota archaeon]|nr:DUF192 domain-containing protein [Candidatus Marsarchaeota archaeon]
MTEENFKIKTDKSAKEATAEEKEKKYNRQQFNKGIKYGFFITIIFVTVVFILLVPILNNKSAGITLANFPVREIGFKTLSSNQIINYYVYVAATLPLQLHGYMNSSSLGNCNNKSPCLGMLFLFNKTQNICMWMNNTKIPLEQIWFNSAGDIVNETAAHPYSVNNICNYGQFVLETNRTLPMNYILTT